MSSKPIDPPEPQRAPHDEADALRWGYSTGACATAAVKAAFRALAGGAWDDPVAIDLPRAPLAMRRPNFPLIDRDQGAGWASAAVEKDAGDDPDVTHGAIVRARVSWNAPGAGVRFLAGEGVGRVTKPGLPIPPGEPAINPAPREMIRAVIAETAQAFGAPQDLDVEIAIDGGADLAKRTWNPRLGIEGGLSILGTTGVVRPFSCAAWIASIHRGVDVARASGSPHVVGSTGATSEAAARAALDLPDWAYLDMGDFAGGLLKYLAKTASGGPIRRLTIAGGFGKLVKLSQGALDLHSKRSQVDFGRLADTVAALGGDAEATRRDAAAAAALEREGDALARAVADAARARVRTELRGAALAVSIMVVDRGGRIRALSLDPEDGPA